MEGSNAGRRILGGDPLARFESVGASRLYVKQGVQLDIAAPRAAESDG